MTEYIQREMGKDKSMANTGGLLLLISGVIICVFGVAAVLVGTTVDLVFGFGFEIGSGFVLIGLGIIVVGALVALTGYDAMRRRKWMYALVCCVVTMFFGPILLVLGTVSLVLIAISRPDFID